MQPRICARQRARSFREAYIYRGDQDWSVPQQVVHGPCPDYNVGSNNSYYSNSTYVDQPSRAVLMLPDVTKPKKSASKAAIGLARTKKLSKTSACSGQKSTCILGECLFSRRKGAYSSSTCSRTQPDVVENMIFLTSSNCQLARNGFCAPYSVVLRYQLLQQSAQIRPGANEWTVTMNAKQECVGRVISNSYVFQGSYISCAPASYMYWPIEKTSCLVFWTWLLCQTSRTTNSRSYARQQHWNSWNGIQDIHYREWMVLTGRRNSGGSVSFHHRVKHFIPTLPISIRLTSRMVLIS